MDEEDPSSESQVRTGRLASTSELLLDVPAAVVLSGALGLLRMASGVWLTVCSTPVSRSFIERTQDFTVASRREEEAG